MRKWLANLFGSDTRKAVVSLKQRVAALERLVALQEHKLLEAARWSSEIDLRFKKLDERLDETSYYKSELDARDEDNARLVSTLARMNPGIIPP